MNSFPEIGSGLPPRAAEVEPPAAVLHAGGSSEADMGVTGNAILLLGYIGGRLREEHDAFYDLNDVDPASGTLLVRRQGTDNIYRISIVQLEGIE